MLESKIPSSAVLFRHICPFHLSFCCAVISSGWTIYGFHLIKEKDERWKEAVNYDTLPFLLELTDHSKTSIIVFSSKSGNILRIFIFRETKKLLVTSWKDAQSYMFLHFRNLETCIDLKNDKSFEEKLPMCRFALFFLSRHSAFWFFF